MLQLETIVDSYSFHSYNDSSAKIIKPDRDIHANTASEDDFIEITSTTFLYKDQLQSEGFPDQFTDFNQSCIELLIPHNADIYLIGTGSRVLFPEKSLLQHIARQKLPIDFMDTGAACRTFNILTGEYRNVAALIFFD